MRSPNSVSPSAGKPPAPSGFGVCQVPDASITARALSRRVPFAVSTSKHERPRLPRLAQHLVGSPAGNGDNTGIGLDRRRQFGKLCQRREIVVDDLIGGGERLGLRHLPAMALEKFSGDRIDTIAPWRENPDMAPIPKVRADRGTGLVNLDRKAAADKLGGSRQADRSAADDGDREIVFRNHGTPSMFLGLWKYQSKKSYAAASPTAGPHAASAQHSSARKPRRSFMTG